ERLPSQFLPGQYFVTPVLEGVRGGQGAAVAAGDGQSGALEGDRTRIRCPTLLAQPCGVFTGRGGRHVEVGITVIRRNIQLRAAGAPAARLAWHRTRVRAGVVARDREGVAGGERGIDRAACPGDFT